MNRLYISLLLVAAFDAAVVSVRFDRLINKLSSSIDRQLHSKCLRLAVQRAASGANGQRDLVRRLAEPTRMSLVPELAPTDVETALACTFYVNQVCITFCV